MSEMLHFTLGELLEDTARRFPDNDALVYPDRGLRMSYGDLDRKTDALAKGLLKLGVKPGDHVALWASNVPEWVLLMFATAKVGAVLVAVDTNYQAAELEYALNQSRTSTLFLTAGFKDNDYLASLRELVPELAGSSAGQLRAERLPHLRNLVLIGEQELEGALPYAELEGLGAEISAGELAAIQQTLGEYDVINMQYTSGVAGTPRGVMLTHHAIVNNGYLVGQGLKFSERDRLCIPLPFYHCFGCVLGVMLCVTHGAAMVPLEAFSVEPTMEVIQAERCTALHGVPTMFIALLEHPRFRDYNLLSLRTGIMAGAPCPIDTMKQVISDIGAKEVAIGYGQTEAAPLITLTAPTDPPELRVSTVGKPLPGVEVRLVDPVTGQTCGPGREGEICTRSSMVMQGYYNMPEETARSIDKDGWLHTGDLGMQDEIGYYRITGRLKNMIIRGGQNIYPVEIEEFLQTHPKVSKAQVYGVPDKTLGEQVAAVAKYKIPYRINVVD